MFDDNGNWIEETRHDDNGNWLDISNERLDMALNRMETVEKYLDGMMCGNNLTHEQRNKLEEAWHSIRSIYYPCVLEKENKK